MSEHDFARKLTKSLRNRGIYVWKINANFAVGVPDMWIAGPTGDMWLELKWGKLPIRNSTAINLGLSHKQLHWLTERHLQGVRVAVVWGCPYGVLVLDMPKDWTGMDTERAKTLLIPYQTALDAICCKISTGDASDERTRPPTASPSLRPKGYRTN